MRFIDTNVLLYALSERPGEERKNAIANEILLQDDLALSTQVLQEFYVQATRVSRENALTHQQAAGLVLTFTRFPVQPTTVSLVQAAIEARSRFGVSYWDAAIIEAARSLGCREILSEDLSDGQDYAGIVVINPFR